MQDKYSKYMFKNDLEILVSKSGYDPVIIAKYTSKLFSLLQADIDLYLRGKMLDIMTMEDGSEFEMTEKEFKEFLNNL